MAENPIPENVRAQVSQMRKWLDAQPHLPKDITDFFLLRFLHSCYYDIAKAQIAADKFFTIRSSVPELLNNRDPLAPEIQKYSKYICCGGMDISRNRRLWMWQVNDPGLDHFDYITDCKLFFMSMDMYLLHYADPFLYEEDIFIIDAKDISLKFVTKFSISTARKVGKYQGEALPVRLTQIHVINAPSFIDKLFTLMKPFFKKEIMDAVHFHSPNSNTLSKYLDKDDLPEDFGGAGPKLEEIMKTLLERLQMHREELLSNNLWRAIDKKSKSKNADTGVGASFRSLGID